MHRQVVVTAAAISPPTPEAPASVRHAGRREGGFTFLSALKTAAQEDDAESPSSGEEKKEHAVAPIAAIVLLVIPTPLPVSVGLPAAGVEPPAPVEARSPAIQIGAGPIAVSEAVTAPPAVALASAVVETPVIGKVAVGNAPAITPPTPKLLPHAELAFAARLTASEPHSTEAPAPVLDTPPETPPPVVKLPEEQRARPEAQNSPKAEIQAMPKLAVSEPQTQTPGKIPAPELKLNKSVSPPSDSRDVRQTAGPATPTPAAPAQASSNVAPVIEINRQRGAPEESRAPVQQIAASSRVEPLLSAAPARGLQPATEISVVIPASESASGLDRPVALQFLQRGSEIHVAVRTPDVEVARTLRQDLGRLVNGLDQAGFRADTWQPAPATSAGLAQDNHQGQSRESDFARDGKGPGGGDGRSEQNGRDRREQRRDQPQWVTELERQKDK